MAHGNELNNKRFYWLKMDRHFFGDARVKKLRSFPKGDACVIVYLKLLLLSIELCGVLIYEGIEDTFEKEMALKIGEKEVPTGTTISFLKEQGMLVPVEGESREFLLIPAQNSIGSETKSNVYKREKRVENSGLEKFQPSSNQIPIEKEIDIDKELDKRKKENKELSAPKRACAREDDDFSQMTDDDLVSWGITHPVDLESEEGVEKFTAYSAECDRRTKKRHWEGKIVKGRGVIEKLKSHEQVLTENGIKGPLKLTFLKFLRNCYLNGHLVSNDKLEDIIFRLNERHGTDADADKDKIEDLEAAISGGYFDIRR